MWRRVYVRLLDTRFALQHTRLGVVFVTARRKVLKRSIYVHRTIGAFIMIKTNQQALRTVFAILGLRLTIARCRENDEHEPSKVQNTR